MAHRGSGAGYTPSPSPAPVGPSTTTTPRGGGRNYPPPPARYSPAGTATTSSSSYQDAHSERSPPMSHPAVAARHSTAAGGTQTSSYRPSPTPRQPAVPILSYDYDETPAAPAARQTTAQPRYSSSSREGSTAATHNHPISMSRGSTSTRGGSPMPGPVFHHHLHHHHAMHHHHQHSNMASHRSSTASQVPPLFGPFLGVHQQSIARGMHEPHRHGSHDHHHHHQAAADMQRALNEYKTRITSLSSDSWMFLTPENYFQKHPCR